MKALAPYFYERIGGIMIYNDLNESVYSFSYDKLTFYFSSHFYLEKFKKEYVTFLKEETMKFRIKYKCNVYIDEMLLLLLYKKIEKRGFRVLYNGSSICENYMINCEIDACSYEVR